MAQFGLSTELVTRWLGTLRNQPFVAPITCVQLHVGFPGWDGTANPSLVVARQAAMFDISDDLTGLTLAGASPIWPMVGAEMLTHISVWSGYEGDPDAIYLWPALLLPPRQVADGDRFSLASCSLKLLGMAAD